MKYLSILFNLGYLLLIIPPKYITMFLSTKYTTLLYDKQEFHQNSFFPVGIKLWNALDDSLKCVNTLSSFKALLVKRNISVATKLLKLRKKLFCTGDRCLYWNVIHPKLKNVNDL